MSKHIDNEAKFVLQKNINDMNSRIEKCKDNISYYKNKIEQEKEYKEIYQRELSKLVEEMKGFGE